MPSKPQYAFHNMKLAIGGRFVKFESLKFNFLNFESEYIYGNSDLPQAIALGEVNPEGSVEMLQDDYQALLNAVGGEYNLAYTVFNPVLIYKPKVIQLPLVTKVFEGFQIVKADEGMGKSDKYMKVALEFKFLNLKSK